MDDEVASKHAGDTEILNLDQPVGALEVPARLAEIRRLLTSSGRVRRAREGLGPLPASPGSQDGSGALSPVEGRSPSGTRR